MVWPGRSDSLMQHPSFIILTDTNSSYSKDKDLEATVQCNASI